MNHTNSHQSSNAWMLTSTALVYMMTPALACFYGGLVENKNFLNQLFLSIVCMAIIPVQWCLFGFSFTFGSGNAVFGSFDNALQRQTSPVIVYIDDVNGFAILPRTFAAFQSSFAIITPALISGAVVGRMKLIPYIIFIFLWATCCYDPIARWVLFSRGWLNQIGVVDFAGGLVVHFSSGVSGLVAAVILGSRAHYDPDVLTHGQTNLPYTVLGTGLLWVGWMGFSGGSAFSANDIASLAIVNTNASAAASMVVWIFLDIIKAKHQRQQLGFVSIPGVCSATVVGLVVITPAAGYVQPGYALLMGAIGGFVVYMCLASKKRFFRIDDTLDVFSCHGVGGFVGTILTGLFSQKDINSSGGDGAFYGNPILLWYQLIGIAVVGVYAAACTAIILLGLHFTMGIRIDRLEQVRGLDNVAHGVLDLEQPAQLPPVKMINAKQKPISPNTLAANTTASSAS